MVIKMEPIVKKVHTHKQDDKTGLYQLYQYWLKDNNGRQLLTILSKFSRVDAVLQSGDTTVLIEYKKRSCSIAKYRDGFILEREKFESMRKASELFESPAIYITDYTDATVIHQIKDEYNYIWSKQLLPSDQHKNIMVEKEVTIIPFEQADFIIGKKTWERAPIWKLYKYFRKIDSEDN